MKFTGTGDLKAASGVKLAGGTNVTSANGDVTAFVDKMEGIKFNTLCFPVTDATLQTAAITKIKYMRESMGKGVNVVLPDAKSPDHEGVINVTNSVVVDGVELTHAEACAFVAGITASASCIKSNTYEVYNGATGIVDPKDNEAAIAAIKNGEMFFSYPRRATSSSSTTSILWSLSRSPRTRRTARTALSALWTLFRRPSRITSRPTSTTTARPATPL